MNEYWNSSEMSDNIDNDDEINSNSYQSLHFLFTKYGRWLFIVSIDVAAATDVASIFHSLNNDISIFFGKMELNGQ